MSPRKIREYTKFFPFSPGIPWKFRKKYLVPYLDDIIYRDIVKDKDVIVSAFGGPLESFFSLSLVEMFVQTFSLKKHIYWTGESSFNFLVYAQGLARVSNININKEIIEKYPVPLFLDAKANVYANCLNNYIYSKSYWGSYPCLNKEPLLKQIFDNAMVPWDDYVPKLRNLPSSNFDIWKKLNNYSERKKTIIIFPNKNDSIHNFNGLGWSEHNIREFSALLHGTGIQLLVCSDVNFYGTNIKTFRYDLEIILNLLRNCWVILSESIDWHLIAMMLSNTASICLNNENYDLIEEIEFIQKNNVIYIEEFLSPKIVKSLISLF